MRESDLILIQFNLCITNVIKSILNVMVHILILLTEKKKNKKATINSKNEDDKCFQYAATVALNSEKIKCNPERF